MIREDIRERFQKIVARADEARARDLEAIRNGPPVPPAAVPTPAQRHMFRKTAR